ncbi:MAG: peptidoglycan-binding domain-containing protein [Candidatus Acidiferrales bacterium]
MKRLVLISSFFVACIAVCAAAQPALASASRATKSRKHAVASRHAKKAAPRNARLVTVAAHKRRRHHYYSRRYHYHGPTKPSAGRVTEIQTALVRSGYYKGDPNGKWDASSIQAMRSFQEDHGLDGNGKIDALSLQKLGLGSEIAGVDAPRPPAPKASLPVGQSAPAAVPGTGVKPQPPQAPQVPKAPDGSSVSPTPGATTAAPGTSPAATQSSTDSSSSKTSSPVQ